MSTSDLFSPSIDTPTAERVMCAVLGSESCRLFGSYDIQPVGGFHHDTQTRGIFRVTGKAECGSTERSWSAVLKVVDPDASTGQFSAWTSTDREHLVYERGLFQSTNVPFRSAKSYGLSKSTDGLNYMWMEDLSRASSHPWALSEYMTTGYNVGRFNGHYATASPETTALQLPSRQFAVRYSTMRLDQSYEAFRKYVGSHTNAARYSPDQVHTITRLDQIRDSVIEAATSLPVSLAHGDCHARNLFDVGGSTVAIDWSGLALEPLGADLGMLFSSGLLWTLDEYLLLVGNREALVDSYISGLRDSNWNGDSGSIRLGFYAQVLVNLSRVATMCALLAADIPEGIGSILETMTETSEEHLPADFQERVQHIGPIVEDIEALLL